MHDIEFAMQALQSSVQTAPVFHEYLCIMLICRSVSAVHTWQCRSAGDKPGQTFRHMLAGEWHLCLRYGLSQHAPAAAT